MSDENNPHVKAIDFGFSVQANTSAIALSKIAGTASHYSQEYRNSQFKVINWKKADDYGTATTMLEILLLAAFKRGLGNVNHALDPGNQIMQNLMPKLISALAEKMPEIRWDEIVKDVILNMGGSKQPVSCWQAVSVERVFKLIPS